MNMREHLLDGTAGPREESLARQVADYDWAAVGSGLDADGSAVLPRLLDAQACAALAALYPTEGPFRSRVLMQRHGFGQGEYKYFAYPLPDLVQVLRTHLYARLAPLANHWQAALGLSQRFPERHADYLAQCHAAGQVRPTPLLLRYGAGDYNCLHQDLYGAQVFPLQVIVLLSQPGRDFEGGELVMTEQRPRMQSRAQVIGLRQGDAAIIAVHHRPVQGTRGVYRVHLRHGVSRVTSGLRHTLGVVLHDAT